MKIHLIAIGGAAMHNLALALQKNGHTVSGSDDEIYNPAYDRLKAAGILPETFGWFPEKITADLDAIILGMHARKDNPELLHAQSLGLKIYSYPAFIYQHAQAKKRVVIAGSHGKTTTTSMILHVLKALKKPFDYLVGAQIEGFDLMVGLSDAPVMVIEGDEYLASPIDLVPKIHHYRPHVAVITGIAWDHMNVFPTFQNYVEQFSIFINTLDTEGVVFFDKTDKELVEIADTKHCKTIGYDAFESKIEDGKTLIKPNEESAWIPLSIFGDHNLKNMRAAHLVCRELGVSDEDFFNHIKNFKGAAKRLQLLAQTDSSIAFLDFAHAPSKVRATIDAMKAQYPERRLLACLELHTYSSLNKNFLPQYAHAMNAADEAIVFFNEHTLAMKKMPPLSAEEIKGFFQHPNLHVFTDNKELTAHLTTRTFQQHNLLLMTSGNFVGLDLKHTATALLQK